jgi:hypothetical protein
MKMPYGIQLLWLFVFLAVSHRALAQTEISEIYAEAFFRGNIISADLNACINQITIPDPSPRAVAVTKAIYQDIASLADYGEILGVNGAEYPITWHLSQLPELNGEDKLILKIAGEKGWLINLVFRYLRLYSANDCFRWAVLAQDGVRVPTTYQSVEYGYEFHDMALASGTVRYGPIPLSSSAVSAGSYSSSQSTQAAHKNVVFFNRPSAQRELPSYLFTDFRTLAQVNNYLSVVLNRCNYTERKYFEDPNGDFEIMTAIEEITPDGRFIRWLPQSERKPISTSIWDYLKMLVHENKGYYRFLVLKYETDEIKTVENPSYDFNNIYAISQIGQDRPLVSQVLFQPTGQDDSNLWVYVYEFECSEYRGPRLTRPSKISWQDHLLRSGLWQALHQNLKRP